MGKKESGCIICGERTKNIFNISLNPVAVCEECATAIFVQQANYYSQLSNIMANEKKEDIKKLKAFKQ